MTTDTAGLGPPPSLSGAAIWFGRNFLEALIWALAGAVVLVLVLTAYRYPVAALGFLASILVIGAVAWGLTASRPKTSMRRASILQFEIFHVTIKVIVGSHSDLL